MDPYCSVFNSRDTFKTFIASTFFRPLQFVFPLPGVEDGRYLSEDWMFCHRWRKMNEDVYIDEKKSVQRK